MGLQFIDSDYIGKEITGIVFYELVNELEQIMILGCVVFFLYKP